MREIYWAVLLVCVVGGLFLFSGASGAISQEVSEQHTLEYSSEADYEIDSMDEFDYYNSRGWEDQTGSGHVVVVFNTDLNLTEARDDTIVYDNSVPLILKGDVTLEGLQAPTVDVSEEEANLMLDELTLEGAAADGPDTALIESEGAVKLQNVTIRDTIHTAAYPTDVFEETYRVSLIDSGDDVEVEDSEFILAERPIEAAGDVTIRSSVIKNASSGGIKAGGTVDAQDVTLSDITGDSGLAGENVVADQVTITDVRASSGGAISASEDATIRDSIINNAHARYNGGAVVAGSHLRIEDTQITEATSSQSNSIYGYDELTVVNSTLKEADALQPSLAGYADASATLKRSHLVNVETVRAETITATNVFVDHTQDYAFDARELTVTDSEIRHTGGLSASRELIIQNTLVHDVETVGGSAPRGSIIIVGSTLTNLDVIDTFNPYHSLEIRETTIVGTNSPLIPEINDLDDRTLDSVNVIDAEEPVFEGTVPDRDSVFIDTAGNWENLSPDLYWSTEEPFEQYLPPVAVIDDATIKESNAVQGEEIVISAKLVNQGGSGNLRVDLRDNETTLKTEAVSIEPGETATVDFSVELSDMTIGDQNLTLSTFDDEHKMTISVADDEADEGDNDTETGSGDDDTGADINGISSEHGDDADETTNDGDGDDVPQSMTGVDGLATGFTVFGAVLALLGVSYYRVRR
ncbi:hypothetical protein [Natronosalvus amylolyticus]|uniref:hypothetical protein n=1 Tax=Natronosalvus amylolyticus TaxID=2961994 RepID=UPI0020C9EB73|nr:hypothetical protein [Natronosalvus amylolyticus]